MSRELHLEVPKAEAKQFSLEDELTITVKGRVKSLSDFSFDNENEISMTLEISSSRIESDPSMVDQINAMKVG